MQHKHHAHTHVAGFLAGVTLIGGMLGGVSALNGKHIFSNANAYRADGQALDLNSQHEVIQRQADLRKDRREKRLNNAERVTNDVGVTYPMRVNPTSRNAAFEIYDVALNVGYLSYPNLGINAPLHKPSITSWQKRDWKSLETQMQFGLQNGVVAYPHSSEPGAKGTMIIAGHSSPPTIAALESPYGEIFASLTSAHIGDRIEIRKENGLPAIYEVYDMKVISASYTEILLQHPDKRDLILFTCYPVGTTRERFAIWAKYIDAPELASAKS